MKSLMLRTVNVLVVLVGLLGLYILQHQKTKAVGRTVVEAACRAVSARSLGDGSRSKAQRGLSGNSQSRSSGTLGTVSATASEDWSLHKNRNHNRNGNSCGAVGAVSTDATQDRSRRKHDRHGHSGNSRSPQRHGSRKPEPEYAMESTSDGSDDLALQDDIVDEEEDRARIKREIEADIRREELGEDSVGDVVSSYQDKGSNSCSCKYKICFSFCSSLDVQWALTLSPRRKHL